MTALRHGAERVYGVESSAFGDWTAGIASRNAPPARYVVFRGSSREIDLPEPVDLVVCDQLGAFICEGQPLPALSDAAERHLVPGGHLIPSAIEFGLRAVRSATVTRHLDFWLLERFALDVTSLREAAVGTPLYERTPVDAFAGPLGSLGSLRTALPADAVDLRTTLDVDGDGPINGLAGSFNAELAPGVIITNAPGDPSSIDRDNIVLPLDPPIEAVHGDVLDVRVRALPHSGVLAWSACGRDRTPRRHSTWQGYTGMSIPRG